MSLLGGDALEAGDDRDPARRERLADPVALDLEDLRLAVLRVGDDPGLRTGEGDRRDAELLDRHAQQRHRDALTRGEQHVHLPARRALRDVVGQADQVVGGLAHGRDHDDDLVAGPAGADDVVGDRADAIRIGDRRAAELLDDNHLINGTSGPAGGRTEFPRAARHYDLRLVTRADKRARQKERSRQAKEAREAAEKREQRKSMALRFGVSAVIVAALIGITALVTNNKDDNKSARTTATSAADDHDADHGRARGPSHRVRRHHAGREPESADRSNRHRR